MIPEAERLASPARTQKKVANSLVALSSAAVLAIYAAGYSKTRSAAEDLEAATQRRLVVPAPPPSASANAPIPAAPLPAAVDSPISTQPSSALPPATSAVTLAPSERTLTLEKPSPKLPVAKGAVESPSLNPAASTAVSPDAAPPAALPTTVYKDGTYYGWGYSRHGDIYAFVTIEKGRIVHSGYDKCRTLWPCTLVDHLGPQVVNRQSAEVDYVSGATESGNAFYWGIVEALSKAKAEAEAPVEAKPEPSEPK
jgi:uncharacterized protein with FMN-binding domain